MGANMASEIPNWFVICLGIGTVFVGLISIIILCKILGALCGAGKAGKASKAENVPTAAAPAVIENRQEIIAAVTAAAAEEMGTDISAIRVLSFKKL